MDVQLTFVLRFSAFPDLFGPKNLSKIRVECGRLHRWSIIYHRSKLWLPPLPCKKQNATDFIMNLPMLFTHFMITFVNPFTNLSNMMYQLLRPFKIEPTKV
jgi:hypothetical protein